MCGICGIVNIDGQPIDLTLLQDMTRQMYHRGPDDEGIYTFKYVGLGVRRLNVIDLATGHQPICNEDESVWVVQNGEIYNYRELRRESETKGHVYKTNSDTEVIVHLYEEYGHNFVTKLNGMFAIGLWDTRNEKLILARDRIGIKPLFYFADKRKLIFSSEIKSILKDSNIVRDVNMESLVYYLTYKYAPAPLTMIKDIVKLLPGHMLIYEKGNISINRYWDFEYRKTTESASGYLELLHGALSESIQRHLISDVPLGLFLSGGIDSSILLATMNELVDTPIETFSITFEDENCDESKYARMVANQFRANHHELAVEPDTINILPKLIRHMDEPLGDSCTLPMYYLSKFAREHVTVALSGDGGDELFAGYDRYRRERFFSYYDQVPPCVRNGLNGLLANVPLTRSKASLINQSSPLTLEKRYKLWMEILEKEARNELIYGSGCFNDNDSADIVLRYFNDSNGTEHMAKMQYADLKSYLPDDLLLKVDQMSMANSLEVRVPFLDIKVLDIAATIPSKLKLRGFSTTKYLLRKYLEKRLPKEIYRRKKQGFNLPVDSWFRGELKSFAFQVLLDPGVRRSGIFSSRKLESILEKHQEGHNYGEAIWALIVFELWHKEYINA